METNRKQLRKMAQTRGKQAKLNILVTLLCQLVTLLCGVIVPKLLIDGFGSEAYGATASITQFLSYIALLEGGVGSVARAALYKPLSENNMRQVSLIMSEVKRFFSVIAIIFIGYVLVLACSFKYISNIQVYDWTSTFFLVIVISISSIAQYFIGISNIQLLTAANKAYVIKAISIATVIANALLVYVFVKLGFSLVFVKLASSIVFALRPVLVWIYVKRQYKLVKCKERDPQALKQKWEGLGQHIAYFLHYNTDIAILTVCADLALVAVYSVYNMVIYHIQNITFSFSAGMEAMFGDLLAKKEHKSLHRWFDHYETLISVITVILFSTTASMIVPFVKLYTAGVTDADYVRPLFALILTLASVIYCLRLPYHSMTIAAGHFKQTRAAAYGEAIINIVLSLVLVWQFELVGVAFATFIATLFRLLYYVIYLSNHIFERPIGLFVKRIFVNAGTLVIVYILQGFVVKLQPVNNYWQWAFCAAIAAIVASVIVISVNFIFYRSSMLSFVKSFTSKFHR